MFAQKKKKFMRQFALIFFSYDNLMKLQLTNKLHLT